HDQAPADLQAVFVPVGGGGLLAGVALALKQLRPGIKVFGVEAEDSAAMAESLRAGGIVSLDHVGQFADGCAVRRVGEVTFHLVRRWADGVIRVSTDEICAAVKEIYEDCRALVEPAGALGFAGLKKWAGEHPGDRPLATILSGANLNFDRLQFIAERAGVGERAEVILAIRIPERPGSFLGLIRALHGRSITEFNYRIGPSAEAAVFVGVSCQGEADVASLLARLKQEGFPVRNLTGDETAKSHIRHMVGGRSMEARNERIFRVEFPERPGALEAFLTDLDGRWNISLFHYRNHGSDRGRALVGFQVAGMDLGFERFIADLEDRAIEVGDSPAVDLFLRPTNIART
ncbi:MAG: threonine ammonia-lyase, biosynthetic, partial [Fimbriimonadaceae bacterium]|nr:threonine ammonia-lyase, biosynthetic [Fimbriimonadaceae bacterium]